MFLRMDNQAANTCLLLEGVDQRDVMGQTFRTNCGALAKIVGCNPRASLFKWTVEINGKKVKCPTNGIDWAAGPCIV